MATPRPPRPIAFQTDLINAANAEINRLTGTRVRWFGLPVGRRITRDFSEHLKRVVRDRILQGETEGEIGRFRRVEGLVSHTLKNYREQWLGSSEGKRVIQDVGKLVQTSRFAPVGLRSGGHYQHWLHEAAFRMAHEGATPISIRSANPAERQRALEILRRTRWPVDWRAFLFKQKPAVV
ncbi:MAG: hypothetical protein NTY90_00410 [Candidatus Micrarchaeota archaeon]|nr:hypothetical protein [Candidatus Micrarchaeota archaeon]